MLFLYLTSIFCLINLTSLQCPECCTCNIHRRYKKTYDDQVHFEIYNPNIGQGASTVLTEAEELLNNYQEDEYKKIIRSIYNTIPAGLHKIYVDNIEINNIVKERSVLQGLLSISPETMIIAYPNKTLYADEPSILTKTEDDFSDPTSRSITFTPEFLDFGSK